MSKSWRQTISGRLATALLLVALIAVGFWRYADTREYSQSAFLMSTQIEIKAYGLSGRAALAEVFARLSDIDQRMRVSGTGSEIEAINANAGVRPVAVSADTFTVIQRALEFSQRSDGKFDITIQPVVALWGIGTGNERVPSAAEIRTALALVDYRNVQLDASEHTVYLTMKGMGIDLGGIAKGYAADEAKRILSAHGVKHALLSIGESSITALGERPDGKDWRVGIQDPVNLENGYMAVLSIGDAALSTSGAYERYFIKDGVRYHHIIDPATGSPAESDVASVTIVSPAAIDGDALSTAVFILGRERGMALIEASGLNCVVITTDNAVWYTNGLAGHIELASEDYHYAAR